MGSHTGSSPLQERTLPPPGVAPGRGPWQSLQPLAWRTASSLRSSSALRPLMCWVWLLQLVLLSVWKPVHSFQLCDSDGFMSILSSPVLTATPKPVTQWPSIFFGCRRLFQLLLSARSPHLCNLSSKFAIRFLSLNACYCSALAGHKLDPCQGNVISKEHLVTIPKQSRCKDVRNFVFNW